MKKHTFIAPAFAFLGISILSLVATGCGGSNPLNEPLEIKTSDLSKTMLNVVGNDDFDRYVKPSARKKTDKDRYVGLFYFTWLGQDQLMKKAVFDNTRLLSDNYGDHSNEYCFNNDTTQADYQQYHFWGKPLYGYYNSLDEWVIRKHMELFTNAGLDFIAFDCTNNFLYLNVVEKVCNVLQEYYDQGFDVPKIVFYTNTRSKEAVNYLYQGQGTIADAAVTPEIFKNGIYKPGLFKDLWFQPDGKPFIVGVTNRDSTDQKSTEAGKDALITDATLLNFFDIKPSQWPNATQIYNGFPWIDWSRPQIEYSSTGQRKEVVCVSVAQHNNMPFSKTWLQRDEYYNTTWGRGWHNNTYDHSDTAILSGQNFEEEFSVAKRYDMKYTFITGWNEWVAGKWGTNDSNYVDTLNLEFSRDAEMMDGGYLDNYYLQIVRNTKDIKNTALSTPTYENHHTININSNSYKTWNALNQYYYDLVGETVKRDAHGFVYASTPTITDHSRHDASKIYTFESQVHYTDNTNRNDIRQAHVASDQDYIYLLVQCKDAITAHQEGDTGWMNILFNVNSSSSTMLHNYRYILNRNPQGNKTSIELYNGTSYQNVGEADYSVDGDIIKFRFGRNLVEATENFKFTFKVTDNITDFSDAKGVYKHGDSAPAGRLGYIYYGK